MVTKGSDWCVFRVRIDASVCNLWRRAVEGGARGARAESARPRRAPAQHTTGFILVDHPLDGVLLDDAGPEVAKVVSSICSKGKKPAGASPKTFLVLYSP